MGMIQFYMWNKNLSDSGISESLTVADQMQEGKAKSLKTW